MLSCCGIDIMDLKRKYKYVRVASIEAAVTADKTLILRGRIGGSA